MKTRAAGRGDDLEPAAPRLAGTSALLGANRRDNSAVIGQDTTVTTLFSSSVMLDSSPLSLVKWTIGTTMSSSGTRSVVRPVAR